MVRVIRVENEYEAYSWCESNGYIYLGTYFVNSEYVLKYDDGLPAPMSDEEMDYYANIAEEMEYDFKEKQNWVIASDDGINSRMYKSKNSKAPYTFNINEAKKYKKSEVWAIANNMTKRSRVGRVWYGLEIK